MSVDPRMTELARAVQRERGLQPKSASVLGPVRVLIAEFIYLGLTRTDMYEFIKRAEIKITYGGMCIWVTRNFGSGAEAVRKATEVVQRAVDDGVFTSPYFTPQAFTGSARASPPPTPTPEISPPRNSLDAQPQPSRQEEGRARQRQIPPKTSGTEDRVPIATDVVKERIKKERIDLLSKSLGQFESPFKQIRDREQSSESE